MTIKPIVRWGLIWHSENKLDGKTRHIICGDDRNPALFTTRKQARDWAERRYGYIRERDDLQQEPHGWRMPKPVRLVVGVSP